MIEDQERYADPVDAGCAAAETWIAEKIEQQRRQMEGHAVHGDIEAEICNGCSYATEASWGKRCDSWSECRADIDRKEKADKRNGRYLGE